MSTHDQYAEEQALRQFEDLRVLGCSWPDETSVEDLGLRTRDCNALRREDLYTVGDVLGWTGEELLDIRQFGVVALGELCEALASRERAEAVRGAAEAQAGRRLDRALELLETHAELLTEGHRARMAKVLNR